MSWLLILAPWIAAALVALFFLALELLDWLRPR